MRANRAPALPDTGVAPRPARGFLGAEARLGLLLVAPTVAVLALIILYPLVYTLGLSFFQRNLLKPEQGTPFVGLENFRFLISSPRFWNAVQASATLTVSTVVLVLVLGIAIGLLLHAPFPARGLVRGLFVLPWAIPNVVAAIIWVWLLNAQFGAANDILNRLGLPGNIAWLSLPATALWAVVVAHVWKELPWVILVVLAGLSQIPEEEIEAARVDGANRWVEFWRITLPHLRPVVVIVVVLETIWVFNWFDYTFLLTGGGPGDATRTLPLEVYNTAFKLYNLGRSSALAAVMFVVLTSVVTIFLRLVRESEL